MTLVRLVALSATALSLSSSIAMAQTKRRGASSSKSSQNRQNDDRDSSVIDDDDGSGSSWFGSADDSEGAEHGIVVADSKMPREEKIMHYEHQLAQHKQTDVGPALDAYYRMSKRHRDIESQAGWFPSDADKRRIDASQREVAVAQERLDEAQGRERALVKRLKPLYGLVSNEFYAEQQTSIGSSLKTMNDMAYNNAWYQSLFNTFSRNGRNQSLQDIIIGFFVQWLMTYMVMYPFAVLYYALWALPWSIFEYSSSTSDILIGVLLWVAWIAVMCLPIFALFAGGKMLVKFYGPQLRQHFEERERRQQQRQQQGFGGGGAGAGYGAHQAGAEAYRRQRIMYQQQQQQKQSDFQ